jgi:hypothetical protein
MRKSLLYMGFGVLMLLGAFHVIAQTFYLYWDMRWFDSFVHFLGGLSMGLVFLWIWFASGVFSRSTPSKKEAFLTALIAGMVIGVGWEVFEYAHGIANPIGNYTLDTFHDLLADFLGAGLAGVIGRNHKLYE